MKGKEQVGVLISRDAAALIAGLIADDEDVVAEDVYAPAELWSEIRTAFPLEAFRDALGKGVIDYEEA